jgi:hypothetical protein
MPRPFTVPRGGGNIPGFADRYKPKAEMVVLSQNATPVPSR